MGFPVKEVHTRCLESALEMLSRLQHSESDYPGFWTWDPAGCINLNLTQGHIKYAPVDSLPVDGSTEVFKKELLRRELTEGEDGYPR